MRIYKRTAFKDLNSTGDSAAYSPLRAFERQIRCVSRSDFNSGKYWRRSTTSLSKFRGFVKKPSTPALTNFSRYVGNARARNHDHLTTRIFGTNYLEQRKRVEAINFGHLNVEGYQRRDEVRGSVRARRRLFQPHRPPGTPRARGAAARPVALQGRPRQSKRSHSSLKSSSPLSSAPARPDGSAMNSSEH